MGCLCVSFSSLQQQDICCFTASLYVLLLFVLLFTR